MVVTVFTIFVVRGVVSNGGSLSTSSNRIRGVRRAKGRVTLGVIGFLVNTTTIIIKTSLLISSNAIVTHRLNISRTVVNIAVVTVNASLPRLMAALATITGGRSRLSVNGVVNTGVVSLALVLPVYTFLSNKALAINGRSTFLSVPIYLLIVTVTVVPALVFGGLDH